jgi:hypothetical protein
MRRYRLFRGGTRYDRALRQSSVAAALAREDYYSGRTLFLTSLAGFSSRRQAGKVRENAGEG